MTDTVKLAATLPVDEDRNGLPSLAPRLLAEHDDLVPLLVLVRPKEIRELLTTGGRAVVLGIVRIEPVRRQDADAAKRMLRAAIDARLGREAIPLDLLEELDAAFEPGGEDGEP